MLFDSFSGIKQSSGNSSGAFALAACLHNAATDTRVIPARLLDTDNISDGYCGEEIFITYDPANLSAFAESIYQVTGCLQLDLSATYKYNNPVNNRNPPSALAHVAIAFGYSLRQIAVCYNNHGGKIYGQTEVDNLVEKKSLLSTEIGLLISIGQYVMVIVGPIDYQPPHFPEQVQLVVANSGSHWLAVSETQLYNPATGYVGSYEFTRENQQEFFVYHEEGKEEQKIEFSGVWIQLKQTKDSYL